MYLIVFIYLIVAYFIPEVGVAALICMVGPIIMAVRKGRYWCGHYCPRGDLYDKIARFSPHMRNLKFLRAKSFRVFMLFLVFGMFGVQIYMNGWTWAGVGRAFWSMILMTTVVGVLLGFICAPRSWCSFCPVGTLAAWVTPRRMKKGFSAVCVSTACQVKCKRCAKVCPMQLTPYDSRGDENGYLHPDCIKCGSCIKACPTKVMSLKKM